MRNFILDKKPTINEAEVTLDGITYHLKMIHGNGCYLHIFQNDVLKDEIALTRTDMKAIFLLLTTE